MREVHSCPGIPLYDIAQSDEHLIYVFTAYTVMADHPEGSRSDLFNFDASYHYLIQETVTINSQRADIYGDDIR